MVTYSLEFHDHVAKVKNFHIWEIAILEILITIEF